MQPKLKQTLSFFHYACPSANNVAEPNWELLSEPARLNSEVERLYPLLHHKAKQLNQFPSLPQKTQNQLRQTTIANSANLALKESFITQLAPKLEAHSIEIILLKGMAFNGTIYQGQAKRQTSDIDILVKEKDVKAAEAILSTEMRLYQPAVLYPFDNLYESTWIHKTKPNLFVDLHTGLIQPHLFPIDYEEVWSRAIPHPNYNSASIKLLSAEDNLAHLAIHVFKDCNFYHYNLIDLHEIICQQQPELESAFEIAKQWHATGALYYLLTIASKELNTPINTQTLEQHSPNWFKKQLAWLTMKKLNPIPAKEKSPIHRLKQLMAQYFVTDKIGSALINQLEFIRKKTNLIKD